MNVSSAIGAAVVFGSLAVSSASANVSDSKTLGLIGAGGSSRFVDVDFVQGHETIAGSPARQAYFRAEMSGAAAARYFDFDVLITLGALSLSSGAFVAAGIAGSRRRRGAGAGAEAPREGWRDEVMAALEADLAQFGSGLRRAA